MPILIFQTSNCNLINNYTQVLCETFQEIVDTITAYKLLDLPEEITIALRDQPFEDDTDELMSIGGCSVKHNLIEMRVPPCYTVKTFITLVHELIHLHQGQLGWLRETDNGKGMLWFDRYYPINQRALTHEQYMSLPWEVMAFREQKDIWNQIKQHISQYAEQEKEQPDERINISLVC
jgi:hypothetical protein